MRAAVILLIPMLARGAPVDRQQTDEADVKAAVARVYTALSAGDLAAFLAFVPVEGYSEFPESGSGVATIDEKFLRPIFESIVKGEIKVDLKATDLQVKAFGNAALVTGFRVGSITPAGTRVREQTLCLTMMWVRQLMHFCVGVP